MKKSRLIIAAAALLGVSVAATTTSTIAWFTSTNKATVSIGNVIAVNASADLKATITGNVAHGTGSTISKNGTSAVSFDIEALRDASVDLTGTSEGAVATAVVLDSTQKVSKFEKKADIAGSLAHNGSYATSYTDTKGTEATGDDEVKDIYYYAEFDIQLALTSTSDTQTYNVFFDPSNTAITDGTSGELIDSSIRFGLRNSKALATTATSGSEFTSGTEAAALSNVMVWAGNYDMGTSLNSTVGSDTYHNYNTSTGLKYVEYTTDTTAGDNPATEGTTETDYYPVVSSGTYNTTDKNAFFPTSGALTSGKVGDSATDGAVATGYGEMDRPKVVTDQGYLGSLIGNNLNANTLTYHAYIWFEGEDLLCNVDQISAAAYNLSLSFFALKK